MKNKQIRKRVGILGGSFNPVTKGHINIAEMVLKHNLVDQIWLLPCFKHNLGKVSISSIHRVEMLYSSIKRKKNIDICLYEIENEADGKLYETMFDLSAIYSDIDYSIIIGMDVAFEINKWYNWKKLIETYPFIVINRKGYDYEYANDNDDNLAWFEYKPHIVIKDKTKNDYSSTLARKAIVNNDNNLQEKLMSRSVINYIKRNKLYI